VSGGPSENEKNLVTRLGPADPIFLLEVIHSKEKDMMFLTKRIASGMFAKYENSSPGEPGSVTMNYGSGVFERNNGMVIA